MSTVVAEHQIIGTQSGRQGAGQVVPEDSVLCAKCGWLRCSEYTRHLSDALTMAANDDALRGRVDKAVGGVLWNAANHPNPAAVMGRDIGPLRDKVVNAVMDLLTTTPNTKENK